MPAHAPRGARRRPPRPSFCLGAAICCTGQTGRDGAPRHSRGARPCAAIRRPTRCSVPARRCRARRASRSPSAVAILLGNGARSGLGAGRIASRSLEPRTACASALDRLRAIAGDAMTDVRLDVGVLDGALTAPGSTRLRATRERRAVRPPSAFVGGSLVRAITKRADRGQHQRRFGRRLYRGRAGAVLSPPSPDRGAEPDTASTHRRARR